MKRYLYFFLFTLFATQLFAQNDLKTCNLGFSFSISNNPNWGNGEPVIKEVTPGSPADLAGLKVNDIILEVNGNGTYLKPSHTIMTWLMMKETEMSLGIRSFEASFKQITVDKDCRLRNAISEAQLAPVFSFYSLEDVQDRKFIIPVKSKTNKDAEFYNYRTFDFAPSDGASSELDNRINSIFVRALSKMGLKQNTDDPDFIIQTFYSYQNNLLYKPVHENRATSGGSWRFDTRNNRMIKLPIFDPSFAVRIDDVMYELEFGYRFYDRKYTEAGAPTLVFESEVQEKLSENFGLLEYLEMNLPLMLLKFPMVGNLNMARYHVKFARFNYTGINYDMNDLKTVVSVDKESPAEKAGIIVGDVITRIDGHNFNHGAKTLTESYRRFIAETQKYRDENTKYTDANGYSNAMFWNISHYYNIAKELSDSKKYKSGFSYLFNFNQYISWDTSPTLDIEFMRNGEKNQIKVKPLITRETQIAVE